MLKIHYNKLHEPGPKEKKKKHSQPTLECANLVEREQLIIVTEQEKQILERFCQKEALHLVPNEHGSNEPSNCSVHKRVSGRRGVHSAQ